MNWAELIRMYKKYGKISVVVGPRISHCDLLIPVVSSSSIIGFIVGNRGEECAFLSLEMIDSYAELYSAEGAELLIFLTI
jgi:hypothetical protein